MFFIIILARILLALSYYFAREPLDEYSQENITHLQESCNKTIDFNGVTHAYLSVLFLGLNGAFPSLSTSRSIFLYLLCTLLYASLGYCMNLLQYYKWLFMFIDIAIPCIIHSFLYCSFFTFTMLPLNSN